MDPAKLAKLQAQVRIGGKGTPRRKHKVVHKAPVDDKKVQGALKKLNLQPISGIEEVNMFHQNGKIMHFKNPKVQANVTSHTFAVTGHGEMKEMTDLLPDILPQLGTDFLTNLRNIASTLQAGKGASAAAALGAGLEGLGQEVVDEDDVPELVENFEEASKKEDK